MSAFRTTAAKPALRGQPMAHDQARALLGQVMGFSRSRSALRSAPASAEI